MVTFFAIIIIGTLLCVEGAENSTCAIACGPNSTHKTCGSKCEQTCGINGGEPRSCEKICAPPAKCWCNDGYARSSNGSCVKPENCCNIDTEHYNECGTACPLTCKNVNSPPQLCTDQCVPGCFCNKGLVRRDDGKCVKPAECPQKDCNAALGEVYQDCGTACPTTCENKNNTVCTRQCVSGCFCTAGKVRRNDGECVDEQSCEVYCGANEVYSTCSTACPQTCKSPKKPVNCIDLCIEGCICKDGLVRNEFGYCVPPKLCDACGPNEIFVNNTSSSCPPKTCAEHYSPTLSSAAVAKCSAGCRCKPGLLLNDANCCVPVDKCCRLNEVYVECGFPCSAKNCGDQPSKICATYCDTGCRCKKDYLWNKDGICVPATECPK